MNKETYEALKRVMKLVWSNLDVPVEKWEKDYSKIETWIDEVAKEYKD